MRSSSRFVVFSGILAGACTTPPLKGLDTGDTDTIANVTDGGGNDDGGPGGGPGGTLDTSTDTAPPLDTDTTGGDTDVTDTSGDTGAGLFNPVFATMYLEFGVNTGGEISDFKMAGFRFKPRFVVTMTDLGGATCDLEYNLDTAAFNTWLTNGTTPPATFNSWLGTQGMYIGMALDAGLYTAVTPLCTFNPTRWTADPHATFLSGEWDFGADDGMPAAVLTILDQYGGIAAFYGATWDPDTALGGYFQVPVGYFGAGSARNMEAFGFAARADANLNVALVGTGATATVIPVVAEDIYDDTTGDFQPVFIRLFSLYQINF